MVEQSVPRLPANATLTPQDLNRLERERLARSPRLDASRYFAVLKAPQRESDRTGAPKRYAKFVTRLREQPSGCSGLRDTSPPGRQR